MQILLNSSWDNVVELISVILIFVFVLLITWLATRYMANFQKSKFSNQNMKLLENIQVGSNKYLSLIELGEVYLVVAVGKDQVSLVAKLTKEELPNLKTFEQGDLGGDAFSEILSKMKDKLPKK